MAKFWWLLNLGSALCHIQCAYFHFSVIGQRSLCVPLYPWREVDLETNDMLQGPLASGMDLGQGWIRHVPALFHKHWKLRDNNSSQVAPELHLGPAHRCAPLSFDLCSGWWDFLKMLWVHVICHLKASWALLNQVWVPWTWPLKAWVGVQPPFSEHGRVEVESLPYSLPQLFFTNSSCPRPYQSIILFPKMCQLSLISCPPQICPLTLHCSPGVV